MATSPASPRSTPLAKPNESMFVPRTAFVPDIDTGQASAAIDAGAFGEIAGFKGSVDRLVRELRASRRLPGVERIRMPGEHSHERRLANERDGLALPAALRAQLDALAAELGIAPLGAG